MHAIYLNNRCTMIYKEAMFGDENYFLHSILGILIGRNFANLCKGQLLRQYRNNDLGIGNLS